MIQQRRRGLPLLFFLFTLIPVSAGDPADSKSGIIVMAHGGSHEWNLAVEKAVAPLKRHCPTALALGMASRETLQSAISELEAAGVERIAVVRLFVSGESFREQTEYFLGLRNAPPPVFLVHRGDHGSGPGHAYDPRPVFLNSRTNPFPPVEARAQMALNPDGLYDSPQIGGIVVERVRALSLNPARESVLILAHGEGDDDLDAHWRAKLDRLADQIRALADFRAVRVITSREDWTNKHEEAGREIRRFIKNGNKSGGRVIVVPFRIFGFGPRAGVLEGLDYAADGRGLLPHPAVTDWLRQQAETVFEAQDWPNPLKR